MNKSRRQKNEPKVVSIQLKKRESPKKQKKKVQKTSEKVQIPKDKFKLPLSKLKKTFDPEADVFDEITKHSQVLKQELKQKRESQFFEEEQEVDFQPFDIEKEDLEIYGERKGYIVERDLQEITNRQLKKILQIVCWRQIRSTFFDFVYALWDSGKLNQVCKRIN